MNYKHTQIGYLVIFAMAIFVLYFGYLFTSIDLDSKTTIIMAVVLIILASFTTLKVTIDKEYLRIKFGYGLFWKKFSLKEITSAKIVKNHWYYGWGIRLWLWPKMWVYNVSGFDAIEIKVNNKTYRIGTDEPMKLESAIKQVIQ
jgi:hypothetical protein